MPTLACNDFGSNLEKCIAVRKYRVNPIGTCITCQIVNLDQIVLFKIEMFASTSRTLFARSVAPQLRNGLRRGIAANVQREARRNRHLMMGGAAFIGGGLWLCLDNSKVVAETLKVDWKKLKEDIVGLLDDDNHDDGSFGPIFVRLAWHSCGTWCKHTKTGGSDGGTMRFKTEGGHGANAGLHTARARLEPLMEKYTGLSHADLYVFAGNCYLTQSSSLAVACRGDPPPPINPGCQFFLQSVALW